ncbi:glucose-1-phosphate adenylyltransferase subunit GlgD [Cetobacterium sp. 8H]|uniref:glucose-1-phosphate adenylyltransferase subunit GlgD n=1 Tax=Cetobacterium sp. 8H TaxID=2759681 RepID=UPI00163BFF23|nr:glucose-1-phosphate adenylyltransferase subunit GlgD [Cetobacterium sp. 8H]MBC2850976.1 glucose-1-phosphate adenylyltransferase subunit GlgD [Cetobacterium sp. 8H]
MLTNYIGIISSFESRSLLKTLTLHRGISTVPIAGKYRAIDFPLSYMINAGIKTINVLTNKSCRSLRTHLDVSKSWGLNRKSGGLVIHNDDLPTDAELLMANFNDLWQSHEDMVVIAPTYMICNINLKKAMEFHELSDADVTVIYKNISEPSDAFIGCDILDFNERNILTRVCDNFSPKKNINISTEVFLIKKDLLFSLLLSRPNREIALKDIIYRSKNNLNIKGFEHKEYLSCLNSLGNYFKTNMDMIKTTNLKEVFFNENRPIFSKIKDSIPTHYLNGADVKNAIISNECSIKGKVTNSVLSRYVTIEAGAEVENCIILQSCTIKSGAVLKNTIVDKEVIVEEGKSEGHFAYPLVIQKNM